MKTKYRILATLTFTLAVVAAYASSLVTVRDAFVHARLSSGGIVQCLDTGCLCDDSGTDLCTLTVATTKTGTGGHQTACSTCAFKTYKPVPPATMVCTTVIFNTTSVTCNSGLTVFELQP